MTLPPTLCRRCPSKIPMAMRLTKSIKNAIARRLEFYLEELKASTKRHYDSAAWARMPKTARDNTMRYHRKQVAALQIVIWMMSDSTQREGPIPNIYYKKTPSPDWPGEGDKNNFYIELEQRRKQVTRHGRRGSREGN